MKEGQEKVYFITGQNKQALLCSPFIEKLKTEGFDVLLFTDPIDEYMIQQLKKYGDYDFTSVTQEGLDLDDKKNEEEETEE